MPSVELNKASYEPYEAKMQVTLRVLQDSFNGIRAGRANPHLLDGITVDYYGTATPIQQVASIQVPEARMITITPWEARMIKEVERAIQSSNIGINPSNDGKMIRLAFPPLTEERRRELTKDVARLAEDAKVAIRNVRREALDHFRTMQKNGEISEDSLHDAEDAVQTLTDRNIEQVDKASAAKNKELMEV